MAKTNWTEKEQVNYVKLNAIGTELTAATANIAGLRVPRIGTVASTATPSIDAALYDQYNITALAAAITSVTVTNGIDGRQITIRIKDNGTARAISWGSSFVSGPATLITTTVISKTHLNRFVYDAAAAKWVCIHSHAAGY